MGRFDALFDSFKLKKKGEEEAVSLGRNICGLPVDTTRALKNDLKTTAKESVLILQIQAFCSYRNPFLDAHAGSTCAATAGPATLGPTYGYTPRPRAQQSRGGGVRSRRWCGLGGATRGRSGRWLHGSRSCGAAGARSVFSRGAGRAAAMSWDLLLWLLALCALLAVVVQLLRFLRADGDLTLLWAEWQGRRPGEGPQPPLGSARSAPCRRDCAASASLLGPWSFRVAGVSLFLRLRVGEEEARLPIVFSPGRLDLLDWAGPLSTLSR